MQEVEANVGHLVSSVQTAVATGRPWAFMNGHAEAVQGDGTAPLRRGARCRR